MDTDKSKSSPAPAKHRSSEQLRNQSTYVENPNRGFGLFFWIMVVFFVVGAILVFNR